MKVIEIPTNCPACDSTLELINQQLFCRNSSCPAKSLKNILHYTKTLKIMGLGEKTLEKLDVKSIGELYSYTKEYLIEKLGEKIGTKLYNEIDKSKQTTLANFITAMGIPLIGKTAANKVNSVTTSINEITEELCKKAGLGEKATNNLITWVKTEGQFLELPITFIEAEPVQSGISVCISGKVPGYTKNSIKELLLDYNVIVRDNVTKDIDYLITNEAGTTKVKKAEQYNIQVISFDNFMEKLNNE